MRLRVGDYRVVYVIEDVPVSKAKAKVSEMVRDSDDHDVLLMRHGQPATVVMSHSRFEALLERMEDMADRLSVYEREGMVMDYEKLSAELKFTDKAGV